MIPDDNGNGSLKEKTEAFLRDFFATGEQLVRELIAENERMRALRGEPEMKLDEAKGGGTANATVSNQLEGSSNIANLSRRIANLERECEEIRRIAGIVERTSGDYRERLHSLEKEHFHLACMSVAGLHFHTASSIDEVLRTVTEILLNFVGIGSFTLFGLDESRQSLFSIRNEGDVDYDEIEISLSTPGLFSEIAQLGRPWTVKDPHFNDTNTLMHLPLVSGTRLVGVARLISFLEQKKEFTDADFSLLSLVSEHAGIGIETAWIRAHSKRVPFSRQSIEELVGA